MTKVVHLQTHLPSSGNAAYRLHNALLKAGITSSMLSITADISGNVPINILGFKSKIISFLNGKLQSYLIKKTYKYYGFFSFSVLGNNISKLKQLAEADVIYIHWAIGGFLSLNNYEQIFKLNKPVIIFMHDMWTITEFYSPNFYIPKDFRILMVGNWLRDFALANTISLNIFTTSSYFSILIVFAVTLFFYNLNALILATVNGFQYYKQYFKINITTTIVGFVLTVTLVLLFEEYGALLAIVLSQSIVCIFAYFYVKNEYWIAAFSLKYFRKEKLLLLLKYTTITILAAVIWPIVQIIIRTYVIRNISAQEAGLWQATRNLNDYIVNIAIGSFSVYLLPKLSSIADKYELKNELISIYKIIIPVTLVGFIVLYIFRNDVILLLYSKEFLKAGDYLLLQMIGAFFWMCKVPIMNYMLAKGHTTIYLVNELIFALFYVVLGIILIPIFQVQGIQMSFAIYNFIYLIVNIVIVNKLLNRSI